MKKEKTIIEKKMWANIEVKDNGYLIKVWEKEYVARSLQELCQILRKILKNIELPF